MNDIEGGGGSGLALTMYDVIMSLITMHSLVTRLTAHCTLHLSYRNNKNTVVTSVANGF